MHILMKKTAAYKKKKAIHFQIFSPKLIIKDPINYLVPLAQLRSYYTTL